MCRETGWLMGALAALVLAWSPGAASAGHGGKERGEWRQNLHRDDGGRERHRWDGHKHRHGRYTHDGKRKFVYDDGHCRHVVKLRRHHSKEVVRCRALSSHAFWPSQPRSWRPPAAVIHTIRDPSRMRPDDGITWNEPAMAAPAPSISAGRYCREYQGTASVGGEDRPVYGQACRQPDGSWEIVR